MNTNSPTSINMLPPQLRPMVLDAIHCRDAAWMYRSKWNALVVAVAELLDNKQNQRIYNAIIARARGIEKSREPDRRRLLYSSKAEYVSVARQVARSKEWDTVKGLTDLYDRLVVSPVSGRRS